MKMLRILLSLVLALLVSACATMRPTMSYVATGLAPSEVTVLVSDTVSHLATPLPPAKSTLVLDPPANRSADVLTPTLLSALRAAGYGVIEADQQTGPKSAEGTLVRYLVSPLENGVLLRLQYLGTEATRFYTRTADGGMVASGPFIVRETGQ